MTATEANQYAGPTVDGRIVKAFVDGVAETCGYFEERARRILARHGIEELQTGESYPLGAYIDAIHKVQRTTGPNTLNRIGRATPAALPWSHRVQTIEDAFVDLGRVFDRAHDGADVGSFEFQPDDHGGTLVADTPYPDAFEQGLIKGIGKHFGTNTGFIAIHESGRYRADGGDVREFDLTWWETRDDVKKISPPQEHARTGSPQSARAD